MRTISIGLSALALTLAGGVIAAQPPARPAAQGPAQPDHDITRAEAKAMAEKLFDRLDANHDGKFDKADREAEHAQRLTAMFDRLDTNHDGQISREEFIAGHSFKGPEGGPGAGPGHDGPPPPPPPGGPEGPGMDHPGMGGPGMKGPGMERHRGPMMRGHMRAMGMEFAILRRADPNHTGTVTREAFVAAALQMFDHADTNHDGKLTREERRAAMAAMRPAGGPGWGPRGGEGHRGHGDMPPPPPPADGK
ncbi:MAG TPA: EF-hand domain-containing protein [Novosphingobium sp.]|nr:EF-hand domain-containing protein [Novosphingobium sp.]